MSCAFPMEQHNMTIIPAMNKFLVVFILALLWFVWIFIPGSDLKRIVFSMGSHPRRRGRHHFMHWPGPNLSEIYHGLKAGRSIEAAVTVTNISETVCIAWSGLLVISTGPVLF